MEPDERFERIAARHLAEPSVERGTGFGSSPGLKVGGKIFAMLVKEELVVKLPRTRVDELVASDTGARFDPGHGRLMKEWASVPADGGEDWNALAAEAMKFVRPA